MRQTELAYQSNQVYIHIIHIRLQGYLTAHYKKGNVKNLQALITLLFKYVQTRLNRENLQRCRYLKTDFLDDLELSSRRFLSQILCLNNGSLSILMGNLDSSKVCNETRLVLHERYLNFISKISRLRLLATKNYPFTLSRRRHFFRPTHTVMFCHNHLQAESNTWPHLNLVPRIFLQLRCFESLPGLQAYQATHDTRNIDIRTLL